MTGFEGILASYENAIFDVFIKKVVPAFFYMGFSFFSAYLSRGYVVQLFESADELAGITDVHEGQDFFDLGIFHVRNHYPEGNKLLEFQVKSQRHVVVFTEGAGKVRGFDAEFASQARDGQRCDFFKWGFFYRKPYGIGKTMFFHVVSSAAKGQRFLKNNYYHIFN
jgi:hypothetical protein